MPTPSGSRGPGRTLRPSTSGLRPTAPRGSAGQRSTSRARSDPPEHSRSRRARWTGRAAILVLVMLVLAVSYASSMRAWLNQRSDTNALRSEIVQRQQAIKRLQADALRWRDPAFVQAQARVRFGWIMPGQVGYRVVGIDGKVLQTGPTLPASTRPGQPAGEWWQTAWRSVIVASDLPKPAPASSVHPAKKIDRSGRPSR